MQRGWGSASYGPTHAREKPRNEPETEGSDRAEERGCVDSELLDFADGSGECHGIHGREIRLGGYG